MSQKSIGVPNDNIIAAGFVFIDGHLGFNMSYILTQYSYFGFNISYILIYFLPPYGQYDLSGKIGNFGKCQENVRVNEISRFPAQIFG